MGRSPKTPKFDAFNDFENCFGERQTHGGSWLSYLGLEGDIVLEIGAGRADFSLMYAALHDDKRLLAIDLKADRLYAGAKRALEQKISNIAFYQANASQLEEVLDGNDVSEIWLTFPDPYPKDRQAKHRMTNTLFLEIYHSILKDGGTFNIKTDNQKLFDWSKQQIESSRKFILLNSTNDLHKEDDLEDAKLITAYERQFLSEGLKTYFLSASSV